MIGLEKLHNSSSESITRAEDSRAIEDIRAMAEYTIVAKEPDAADSLVLQGAFANNTSESDDGTGGSGRLNNNQLAIVATHRGADASMIARACIDDANVLPCLARKGTTTTHP